MFERETHPLDRLDRAGDILCTVTALLTDREGVDLNARETAGLVDLLSEITDTLDQAQRDLKDQGRDTDIAYRVGHAAGYREASERLTRAGAATDEPAPETYPRVSGADPAEGPPPVADQPDPEQRAVVNG